MKNSTIAKYFALAALLMFVAATLQIVGEQFIVGALLFAAAACFLSAAANYRKKDAEENQQSESASFQARNQNRNSHDSRKED